MLSTSNKLSAIYEHIQKLQKGYKMITIFFSYTYCSPIKLIPYADKYITSYKIFGKFDKDISPNVISAIWCIIAQP